MNERTCVVYERVGSFFAHGAVNHACLAEPAAADAAAENLNACAVMNNIREGNNEFIGIYNAVKVFNYALSYFRLCFRAVGCYAFYCIVVIVFNVIKRWDVNSVNLRDSLQIIDSLSAVFFPFLKSVHKLADNLLALAEGEKVEYIRNRFGIIGARTAAVYKRFILSAVAAAQRYACKVKHVENI